jgi:hypothetical protein
MAIEIMPVLLQDDAEVRGRTLIALATLRSSHIPMTLPDEWQTALYASQGRTAR